MKNPIPILVTLIAAAHVAGQAQPHSYEWGGSQRVTTYQDQGLVLPSWTMTEDDHTYADPSGMVHELTICQPAGSRAQRVIHRDVWRTLNPGFYQCIAVETVFVMRAGRVTWAITNVSSESELLGQTRQFVEKRLGQITTTARGFRRVEMYHPCVIWLTGQARDSGYGSIGFKIQMARGDGTPFYSLVRVPEGETVVHTFKRRALEREAQCDFGDEMISYVGIEIVP